MNYTPEDLARMREDLESRCEGVISAPVVCMLAKLIEDLETSEKQRKLDQAFFANRCKALEAEMARVRALPRELEDQALAACDYWNKRALQGEREAQAEWERKDAWARAWKACALRVQAKRLAKLGGWANALRRR